MGEKKKILIGKAYDALPEGGAFIAVENLIDDARREIDRIDKATDTASKCNMAVYAGRGINYKNIQPLAELDNIDEFFIGHAIVTRALLVGFEAAVKEMLNLIGKSSRQ